MRMIPLAALGAAMLALSGPAASAQDATPYCSKTVTDNCLQREGHAVAAHRAPVRHRAPKHHAAKHRAVAKHRVAARHHPAPHRKVAAKATPARKM